MGVLGHGDSMEIDNGEDQGFLVEVGLFLEVDPVGDGSEIISEVWLASGLDSAENDRLFFGLSSFRCTGGLCCQVAGSD